MPAALPVAACDRWYYCPKISPKPSTNQVRGRRHPRRTGGRRSGVGRVRQGSRTTPAWIGPFWA